ncbi:flavodoxin family protein [Methanobacterium alcaliphilum]|uniref:flavodoxin family protein n=1 Tax=Methanobacterium alcaliphilum TaxID=392018 RepID=UPI00200B05AB|nr:flavodoxin family protein [Methanobacterium alcaliphilum]MCK9151868.1 flavodoxin family protein [Methanobacterium alcaliphilum]
MKSIILNGSNGADTSITSIDREITLKLEENGWDVENIHLNEEKIATCIGCFGCWLETPGECIIKDKGQELAKKVIQSDLLVLLTPITFGGYSYQLKKIVDRLIPNILPFFIKIDGEIHHQPRYEKNPNLLAIGYLPQSDTESELIFTKLIRRNAINMHCPNYHVQIITGEVKKLDLDKSIIIHDNGVIK